MIMRRKSPDLRSNSRSRAQSARNGRSASRAKPGVGEDSLKLLERALSPSGEPVLGLYIHTAEQVLLHTLRSRRAYQAIVPHLIGTPAILSVRPGISQTELGHYLRCSRAAAGKQVVACIKRGWVRRDDSPQDKRRFLLYITPAGAQMLRESIRISPAHEEELAAALSDSERRMLRRLLHKLIMSHAPGGGQSGR